MRLILVVIIVSVCAFALSCSGSGDDPSAANSQADVNISEIRDANQALAVGSELLENNETERAIDALLKATELDPDLAEAWFKLGIAYALIEKEQELNAETEPSTRPNSEKAFRKAIEAYKKILDRNPEDDAALYNLGRAYNKLNEDEDAAKALKQAVKIKADDTEYQTELGSILIKLAQYREAIPPLKKALELDPENARAAGLLEDAEAGRTRIDYVSKKDGNSNANSRANSNANANSNTNTAANPTPSAISTPKPLATPKATPKPPDRPE